MPTSVAQEAVGTLLGGWSLEKRDLVRKQAEMHTMVESINTCFVTVSEQVVAGEFLQGDFRAAQTNFVGEAS